jgi:hypothetical protein
VFGAGGISEPDSAVLGGSGMTEPDSAVLGGGGMTGPDLVPSSIHLMLRLFGLFRNCRER